MGTYYGVEAETTPSLRTDGSIQPASMTLFGIQRVVLTDGAGNPVATVSPAEAIGGSPDNPLWVGSVDGKQNRTQLEGGNLSRIDEPVTVRGPVSITLSDAQLAALLPQRFTLDAQGRLAVAVPMLDPQPGSTPDNPVWVGSVDGGQNRVTLDGGRLAGIDGPVTVQGSVLAGLPPDQLAALRAIPFPFDYAGRVLVVTPLPDPAIQPEVNWVTVTDPVVNVPQQSATNAVQALTVSNVTAVKLASANVSRKSIIITNNSSGILYIGNTSSVTSSGATMGNYVAASGGAYADDGDGLYIGELWGIYSASASSPNVAVSDRS